jgi:hypothetical protein
MLAAGATQAAPTQPSPSERNWIWCDVLLLKKCISCQFHGTFQMVDFPLFVVKIAFPVH